MTKKFYLAFGIIFFIIVGLVYAGVQGSSQTVVTVNDLIKNAKERKRVRLGARVTYDNIFSQTHPELVVKFSVTDAGAVLEEIGTEMPNDDTSNSLDKSYDRDKSKQDGGTGGALAVGNSIPVVYKGVMPTTLKAGRDVILEGQFDGSVFNATSLLTQCPSKYEPPQM